MPGPGWPRANRLSTDEPNQDDWNAIADAPHNIPGDQNGGGNSSNGWLNLTGTGYHLLTGQPRARATKSGTQSINDSTWTTLSFDTESYNVTGGGLAALHSTSVNNSRMTCPVAGHYRVAAQASFASNTTGRRAVRVLVNGSIASTQSMSAPANGDVSNVLFALETERNASDYMELQVWQNSGGALNIATADTWLFVTLD